MNNTVVIMLASLGALLWLYAVLRERYKKSIAGSIPTVLKKVFSVRVPENEAVSDTDPSGALTIDSLERQLGIEADHYLCDRVARINEALVARRDKAAPKKKGGAS